MTLNIKNFKFSEFKMVDGFALKRYGRRCNSLLLGRGPYCLDQPGNTFVLLAGVAKTRGRLVTCCHTVQ